MEKVFEYLESQNIDVLRISSDDDDIDDSDIMLSDDCLLYTSLAEKKRQNPDAKEGVSLLTMHGAKGLEFDTVFILSLIHIFLPLDCCLEKDCYYVLFIL